MAPPSAVKHFFKDRNALCVNKPVYIEGITVSSWTKKKAFYTEKKHA